MQRNNIQTYLTTARSRSVPFSERTIAVQRNQLSIEGIRSLNTKKKIGESYKKRLGSKGIFVRDAK